MALLLARRGRSRYEGCMTMSRAISNAHGPLEEVMLPSPPTHTGPGLRTLLNELLAATQELHFSSTLLKDLPSLSSQELQDLNAFLIRDERVRDHFAACVAIEALHRAEHGGARVPSLLNSVSWSLPPELSKRFLRDAVSSYLLCLDGPCIAMCRGAVEVLVESLWDAPAEEMPNLGRAIRDLRNGHTISNPQARDMWFINDQAKEVLHDEPAPEPLDAASCLIRLATLLADLYPEGSGGAV